MKYPLDTGQESYQIKTLDKLTGAIQMKKKIHIIA
jgi:hypothetical protein